MIRSVSGITIERLPPEREARIAVAAPAGSCCCCCCCLHSVGGLLGAVTAKRPPVPTMEPPTAVIGTDKVEPRYTVSREYWLSLLFICCVVSPAFSLVAWDIQSKDTWFVLAMLMPAMQLVASVAALCLSQISKRPGREERLRHLGTITLRAFIGAVIGFLVMLPMFGLL